MSEAPTASTGPRRRGVLDLIEWLGNKLPDPVILFILGALAVMVASQIGAWAGWEVMPKRLLPVIGEDGQAVVDPATGKPVLELRAPEGAQPIRARGLLSGDGLYWAISSMVDNFVRFPPLGVVLVGVLGIGLAERTGFIGAGLKAMMLVVPKRLLTPAVVFMGVMSSLGTDAGYVVLPPVAAALYKAAGRSPLAGIAAVFAGIAGGFNANLLITSLDPLLAGFTGPAAQTVDPKYTVNPACNWWFMIASTFLVTLVGWATSAWIVEPRLSRKGADEGGPSPVTAEDEAAQRMTKAEVRGLAWGFAAVVAVSAVFLAFTLVPGAPFDDVLYGPDGMPVTKGDVAAVMAGNPEGDARVAQIGALLRSRGFSDRELARVAGGPGDPGDPAVGANWLVESVRGPGLGDTFARWVESIVPMLFLVFAIPGIIYGVVVGTVRSGKDAARLMIDTIAYMAPVIVLAFFAAQFIAYFNFSQLDRMLAYTGGELLAGSRMTPAMLVVAFIILTAVFNLFMASMSAKYAVFAPIFVPMLMLAGIAPELTQASYRIGDSTTNIITPLNSYVVIILVVMQKFAPRAGIGTLISMMLPYTLMMGAAWIAMVALWMQMGWPLGIEGRLFYTGGV